MSTYCISDIHGNIEAFHRLLRQISFSGSDILYIIGDVVDRGAWGIRLLQEIMHMPNAVMILGNHEYMMLDYYRPDAGEIEIRRWNKNGNAPTVAAFAALEEKAQQEILKYLKGLPWSADIEVSGRKFHLVHGFPADTVHDAVWNRPENTTDPSPVPGSQVIIGHTPVPLVLCETDEEEEKYLRNLELTGAHVPILHAVGYIDIDCGSGHHFPGCCLACLRLEDMQEFYEPSPLEENCSGGYHR